MLCCLEVETVQIAAKKGSKKQTTVAKHGGA